MLLNIAPLGAVLRLSIVLLSLSFPAIASAHSPAWQAPSFTPLLGIHCKSDQLILAHVSEARSADCRLTTVRQHSNATDCASTNRAILTLKVLKIVASRDKISSNIIKAHKMGEVFKLSVSTSDLTDTSRGLISRLKPEQEPFADDEAKKIFEGQNFYFFDPYIFRTSDKEHLYKNLRESGDGKSCPKLLITK